MPVLAGSIPATTQCAKSEASMSTKLSANSLVSGGTPLHEMAGDVSAPLHVYGGSMTPPSSQAVVTPNPVGGAAVAGGSDVVVVTIDSVWSGRAGRSVRPSLEQATNASAP